jgi:hypothetical protein
LRQEITKPTTLGPRQHRDSVSYFKKCMCASVYINIQCKYIHKI